MLKHSGTNVCSLECPEMTYRRSQKDEHVKWNQANYCLDRLIGYRKSILKWKWDLLLIPLSCIGKEKWKQEDILFHMVPDRDE